MSGRLTWGVTACLLWVSVCRVRLSLRKPVCGVSTRVSLFVRLKKPSVCLGAAAAAGGPFCARARARVYARVAMCVSASVYTLRISLWDRVGQWRGGGSGEWRKTGSDWGRGAEKRTRQGPVLPVGTRPRAVPVPRSLGLPSRRGCR